MSDNPWLRPEVAQQQRALVDKQLAEKPMPPHFLALAEAVRATQCPGEILDVGCGVGHGREILDRAGVEYRSFAGVDISPEAIRLARERYPESAWGILPDGWASVGPQSDTVIDGCALMHVDDWRGHLAALCRASRRWVILHRVPVSARTERTETRGYGQTFPAWSFHYGELADEMLLNGFEHVAQRDADGDSMTLTFAKLRHYASYCDAAYLPRLKALHASMVRHCGPFVLHVLAFDDGVTRWCVDQEIDFARIADFIEQHPELAIDKLPGPPRTRVEHMWTVGPAFLLSVLDRVGEPCTYIDSDCFLFSSPEPMFAEIGGAPAAVVPHGFADASRGLPGPTRETHEVFGKFNVGIVYVSERAFVEHWAEDCKNWCYDRVERIGGSLRYGDQRFLDRWTALPDYIDRTIPPPENPRAHVIQHPGACAGPWQVHTRALDVRDGVIHFGNRPLIAYHFSGYREGPHGAESLSRPEYQISERQAELIYRPYIASLREAKCSK